MKDEETDTKHPLETVIQVESYKKYNLDTNYNDKKIVDKLTNIGLEVESFESQSSQQDEFVIAKIVNAERHPNADRLSVCDVDIGEKEIVKVVCGAPNAKKDLLTIYAVSYTHLTLPTTPYV